MKYMFLLFNEEREEDYTPDAMAPWMKFEEDAAKVATKQASEALQPSGTATTVSVRGGEMVLTDGPFIDTKEQLGGYYIYDCSDMDEAISLARMIPWASTGHIEVRPVMELPGIE